MHTTADILIEKFLRENMTALRLLYKEELYGHMFIIIYSNIDSMGLLDAPPNETRASKKSFKNWVKKYMLNDPRIEFNEEDFYSARCAVLHTFTSKSNLSNSGNAKEIQYFSGSKNSQKALKIITEINALNGGKHILVNVDDTYHVFLEAIGKFAFDVSNNCGTNPAYEARLRNVLQKFSL